KKKYMNCRQCNAPLDNGARFCPRCGTTITTEVAPSWPRNQPGPGPAEQTLPANQLPPPGWFSAEHNQPPSRSSHQPQHPVSPSMPPASFPQYQQNSAGERNMQANTQPQIRETTPGQSKPRSHRRSRVGMTLGCLSILVILILLVGAIWSFGVRPYLHDTA